MDARVHAKRLLIFSDLHGTLEALLQFLLQTKLAVTRTKGMHQYISWNKHECMETAVLILGDMTDRVRGDKGMEGEMKNEELRILITIYHLNRTHPMYHNAILTILGNHDVNNLMLSSASQRYSSEQCLQFCEKRYGNVAARLHVSGRRKFFLADNNLSGDEKAEIARMIVMRGEWPSMPLFYRDFVSSYDVALYLPTHKLLAVHGGITDFDIKKSNPSKALLHDLIQTHELYIDEGTDMQVWCDKLNAMSAELIESRKYNPIVYAVVQDRGIAGNLVCTDGCMPGLGHLHYVAIGHTHQQKPNMRCNIMRVDAGNNAKHMCTPGMPCLYKINAMVLEMGTASVFSAPSHASTAVCTHGLYQHRCSMCMSHPSMWVTRDFFH